MGNIRADVHVSQFMSELINNLIVSLGVQAVDCDDILFREFIRGRSWYFVLDQFEWFASKKRACLFVSAQFSVLISIQQACAVGPFDHRERNVH